MNLTRKQERKEEIPTEKEFFEEEEEQRQEVALVQRFTKEQILAAKKYQNRKDIVNALVQDGEKCTMEEVDRRMDEFRKGKVD